MGSEGESTANAHLPFLHTHTHIYISFKRAQMLHSAQNLYFCSFQVESNLLLFQFPKFLPFMILISVSKFLAYKLI